jgi:elongation factor Ts
MAITAADVKALRERTGLPMMKCKKALTETDGDQEAAIEALRKAGALAAAKKADRETTNGSLGIALGDGAGVAVLLACETDFVSGNEQFKAFVTELAEGALAAGASDLDSFKDATLPNGTAVTEAISGMVQKLGENMQLADVKRVEGATVVGYNHGGRVASLVAGEGEAPVLRNIAMHVAAASPAPIALDRTQVDEEVLNKEREIISALPDVASKPEHIRPKIVEGKLGRFFKENVLLDQEMLVDNEDGLSVEKYAKAKGVSASAFVRLAI